MAATALLPIGWFRDLSGPLRHWLGRGLRDVCWVNGLGEIYWGESCN